MQEAQRGEKLIPLQADGQVTGFDQPEPTERCAVLLYKASAQGP